MSQSQRAYICMQVLLCWYHDLVVTIISRSTFSSFWCSMVWATFWRAFSTLPSQIAVEGHEHYGTWFSKTLKMELDYTSYFISLAAGQMHQESTFHVNQIRSNDHHECEWCLALSPRGPWQALRPDLAGLYVFGSCTTRWAGARGFGLSKPSKSMLNWQFEIWDFASSQAEYSLFFRQLINWEGKTKKLQSIQRINEASSIQGFSSVVFRPLLQDLILGLDGFDLLDVAPLDLSAAFFIGFSIILARINNHAICANLSLGHSLFMQTAMSSYWTTNLMKGSAWYMPWVFWFTEWCFFLHQYNILFGAVRMFCGTAFFCFASI